MISRILGCLLGLLCLAVSVPLDWDYGSNPELGPYFEGDILNDPEELKSGINSERARWPNKTFVYTIASGFSAKEQQHLQKAMQELSSKTCIQFKQSSSGDYVYIDNKKSGCYSMIGRTGGKQELNLASGCFSVGHGTAMHEMIHALGFFHEQSRPDRDDYVTIHYDRIQRQAQNNFRKESNSKTYNSYDYGSVMHYPKDAFGNKRGDITIEVKKGGASIGQRRELSAADAEKIKRMYNC